MFKWCTRCNVRVPERRCPKCGARDSFTWAFVVAVTPKDAQGQLLDKRKQKWAQGFATRAAAQDALNELQVEKKDGTYIDPSRLTLGTYLATWVKGGCGGVRPWTLKGYESVVRTRLQADAAAKFSAYLSAPSAPAPENLAARERSVSDPDSATVT